MEKITIPFNSVHAVIIGINRYAGDSIPDLKYARSDAEAVYEVLIDPKRWAIPRENVQLLLDEEATLSNIRTAIGNKLRQKADMVYIYFAGHGTLTSSYTKKRDEDETEKYLVPADADYDDIPDSAVSISELAEFLEWKQAKQTVVIIDSSFSGFEGGRSFENPLFPIDVEFSDAYLEDLVGERRAIIVACEANELAIEINNRKQGLFTFFLLEGLQGKAFPDHQDHVLFDDLYEFVYANVIHYAEVFDGNMHPVSGGSLKEDVFIQKFSPEKIDHSNQMRSRVDKLYAMAKRAYEHGDLETVQRIMNNILEIFPEDQKVRKIINAVEKKLEERKRAQALTKPLQSPGKETVTKPPTQLEPEESRTSIPQPEPEESRREPQRTYVVSERPREKVTPPRRPVEKAPLREEEEIVGKIKPTPPREKRTAVEPPPERPRRKRFFTILMFVLLTGLFIMFYAPNLNRHENILLYESLDKSARPLRFLPTALSVEQVKVMLGQHDFYEKHWNERGIAYNNRFESGTDDTVVIDFSSIVMWQRGGSGIPLKFGKAEEYIAGLNREKFAGFGDWRLPTLEEAMSLVEREKQNGDLNISRVFDNQQRSIWTADDESETRKWTVFFYDGNCYPSDVRYGAFYVRAVR
jgi:hypothetical protein